MFKHNLAEKYNPLFFLASLGAGGLAISFFMYPMFMIKHPDTPMVTFNHLWPLLTGDNLFISLLLAFNLLIILAFSLLHFYLLAWNMREYRAFRRTAAFAKLRDSNAEVSLMAIPLTLAMSINVAFVLGALFVPNLWSVVEFLFPFAILGYLAVGIYALRILGDYFTRLFTNGTFDFVQNNNLSQMIAIFALAMIGVGLAAPGAMSHQVGINALAMTLSIFFVTIAMLLGMLKLVLGFKSILEHGIAEAASPSLWITIPIFTLLGITFIRLSFGLHHGFASDLSIPGLFVLTATILSLEILFGLIGYNVMKKLGYFRDYIHGDKGNAGTFSLVCPGVAFFVFGVFFITFGLVQNGLIGHLSVMYFVLLAPFVLIQMLTVHTLVKLTSKILLAPRRSVRPALS